LPGTPARPGFSKKVNGEKYKNRKQQHCKNKMHDMYNIVGTGCWKQRHAQCKYTAQVGGPAVGLIITFVGH
jgi:hypothetical protein